MTRADVHGDLHLHSDWSPDGHMTIEAILSSATERRYQYVALTDHTAGLRFGGLDETALRRQRTILDQIRPSFPDLVVLHGAEINIDRLGRPDLDDATLSWLDFVVAGCHSDFDLDPAAQTARLVRALEHPAVRILSHPTGRRIGIRPGFRFDVDQVIAAAVEFDTALEVNGHRDRMDLPAELAERAAAAGVFLAANSDAHRPAELDNGHNAIGVMQRAGITAASVVNALTRAEFETWVRGRGR